MSPMPEAEICQWCCSRMPARRRRGAERRFCATPCRRAYDKASRRLGQTVAEADFRDPGELRTWFGEARAPRSGFESAQEAPTPIEDSPARPRPYYGFCQHGLSWYATDPIGRKVGSPVKTPEQAQRLARQYTARKLEEPAFSVPLAQIEIDPGRGARGPEMGTKKAPPERGSGLRFGGS